MRKINKIEPLIPQMPVRKKVAAYARVSVESERLHHSLSSQISYYSTLIQKHSDWEYVGVYADDGITGTKTADRAEFNRMLADCEAGKIEIILSEEQLKNICADVLETDSFDEENFESWVKDIIVLKNGDLEFHLVGGETRRWKNLHLNMSRHTVTLTDAFQGKIRCAKCGSTYHRVNSANRWVYWYCMGKRKKCSSCDSPTYTDFQLRQISAHILGLDEFDEQAFTKQIEGITVTSDGGLEYHFYEGRTAKWQRV